MEEAGRMLEHFGFNFCTSRAATNKTFSDSCLLEMMGIVGTTDNANALRFSVGGITRP
jgi:hypothetical protein